MVKLVLLARHLAAPVQTALLERIRQTGKLAKAALLARTRQLVLRLVPTVGLAQ